MIPEAGQRFGPYEILSRVGGGAMGLVFRAWDERLHREVAIKLLHDEYDMPGIRERFLQEARAASALNHPNICTIFDIGEQDGDPYLVMELLEGETLKEKISRGAVPTDEIVCYGQEVADALSAAHAKGIVHRDIKPANIFLVDKPNGKRQAKVLDFGLAKIGLAMRGGRASRALDLTLAGATVGTLSYMSPEQARGQNLDQRSDLFSLGVVMYEMATRQVPFQGATSALIFVQLLHHPPEPPHEWNDSIPRELEKIILKLLAKEREHRFQTANELAEALRKIPFKSGGGWLKKAAAAVPLVRTPDPAPKANRPNRGNSELNLPVANEGGEAAAPIRPVSAQDNMVIRPVLRVPQRTQSSQVEGVQRGDWSEERNDGLSAEAPIQRAEAGVAPDRTVLVPVPAPIRAAAPNQSGVGRYDFEVDDPGTRTNGVLARLEGNATQDREYEDAEEEYRRPKRRGAKMAVAAVLLAAVAGGVGYLLHSGRFRPVLLGPGEPLLLTVIQNRTGDSSLDGTVMQGMELLLRQSSALTVRGGETYRAGLRQAEADAAGGPVSNRRVAQMVGAKAYVYGEIKGSGEQYTISVDVLKSDSNDKLASVQETAAGKDQLAATIGRLAEKLRTSLGEGDGSIAKTSVPLQHEGTANMGALQAYAMGEAAAQSGRLTDAMAAYQRAIVADPKFVQAHLQMAWLYGTEKAEVAAADESKLATDAAGETSSRLQLLAQFCQAMNSSGDYARAAALMRQFRALYPKDVSGLVGTAKVLRAQGYLPEALQAAQQAFDEDPYLAEAYSEAEQAMIGMERSQGALQLQEQARRLGVLPIGSILMAAYLAGDTAALQRESAAVKDLSAAASATARQWSFGDAEEYGLYLDNQGRMLDGAVFWRTAGAESGRTPVMASTEAFLLAQGSLDRALTKDCAGATALAKSMPDGASQGLVASFNAGMAAALCGDTANAGQAVEKLKQRYPQSTALKNYYEADLAAAMALQAKDPKQALAALAGAAEYDQISLTPYLRGLAHLETGEGSLAIADFQTIVDHRGAALAAGSNVYPLAQIGLARAYAVIGDGTNSTAAYRRFLTLWAEPDRGDSLVTEANAKVR